MSRIKAMAIGAVAFPAGMVAVFYLCQAFMLLVPVFGFAWMMTVYLVVSGAAIGLSCASKESKQ